MKPYEFRNTREIIEHLSRDKARIAKYFERRETSPEIIVTVSVGGNTFRAFRGMPKKPSLVFRDWAARALADKNTVNTLVRLRSQRDYDDWLRDFSAAFRRDWQEQMGAILPYGASRKLPDLLLKHFVWWSGLTDDQRRSLLLLLHVPLDSFTLVGMRNCIEDPEIPADATMKFVVGPTMYNQIQDAMRGITKRAGVPAVYYDVLVWDIRR